MKQVLCTDRMHHLVDDDALAGDVILLKSLEEARALINSHVGGDGCDDELGGLKHAE